MPFLTLLGYFLIVILILGFAVWATRKFVPAEFQSYVMLIVGLCALIFAIYIIAILTGVSSASGLKFGH